MENVNVEKIKILVRKFIDMIIVFLAEEMAKEMVEEVTMPVRELLDIVLSAHLTAMNYHLETVANISEEHTDELKQMALELNKFHVEKWKGKPKEQES